MKKNLEIKIFIIVTFIMLICPITFLHNKKISETENRNLATFKPFYDKTNKAFNWSFGTDFNEWLSERFFLREQFINLNNNIKYYLNNNYVKTDIEIGELIIDKKGKFLYRVIYDDFFSPNDINEINSQLKLFNEYCTKKNIKLFLVIVPPNKIVYPPKYIKSGYRKKFDEAISNIDKNNVQLVLPTEKILEEKEKSPYLLYYTLDPHMTLDGNFICYKILMEAIKKDFSNIKILSNDDFDYIFAMGYNYLGDPNPYIDCNGLNIPKAECSKYYENEFRYYQHKDSANLDIKSFDSDKNIEVFYYPKGNNLKIMLFGDSFVASLKKIIPYSFKDTVVVRPARKDFKLIKYYRKDIENFNPDILVIYINYNTLNQLKNLMSQDSV